MFQGVFRITTKENREYLLQAANEEEREQWTTAIANAVRGLDIKYKVLLSLREIMLTYHHHMVVFLITAASHSVVVTI